MVITTVASSDLVRERPSMSSAGASFDTYGQYRRRGTV
jgi:hypothetical protein